MGSVLPVQNSRFMHQKITLRSPITYAVQKSGAYLDMLMSAIEGAYQKAAIPHSTPKPSTPSPRKAKATVLAVKHGCAVFAHPGIENDEHFSDDGDHGDLARLSSVAQACVEGLDGWIEADGW